MDGSIKKKVLRSTAESSGEVEDVVAVEKRLNISVNSRHILSLYCTPLMIRELVTGLLMTEGIVDGRLFTERMSILYEDEINVDVPAEGRIDMEGGAVTSGCAGGRTFQKKHLSKAQANGLSIETESLKALFRRFQKHSTLYRLTGCVHSAALADKEDILCFAEDIGRHNAVDKVIGRCLLEGVGFQGRIMLVSGRLSSEMVSKCSTWGIPMVVSRTAATDLALKIAEESGITVVGFLRGERMNIYTHSGRVK